MAGLSAAWRLSEPGWQDRFDSITVYQRGWRLGGKGASSRGPNGRIEEHGLHIWLGSYENAFTLLRECYAELDRPTTDPGAPIQRWDQALIAADNPGVADHWGNAWSVWVGTHPHDDKQPGDPNGPSDETTAVSVIERALKLVLAFADSIRADDLADSALSDSSTPWSRGTSGIVQRALLNAVRAVTAPRKSDLTPAQYLDEALRAISAEIDREQEAGYRRSWLLMSLVGAVIRGILIHNLVTDPRGFRTINDEDFSRWAIRHGAHPEIRDYPLVRGLYDLVFGYEDGDPMRPSFGAGVMVFLLGQALFEYKGSFFWKMTAGMGDVVFAPLYQALRQRGVCFEFFHRLETLHLDSRRQAIHAITVSRQMVLADGAQYYEPLTTVKGLPVFPDRPLIDQVIDGDSARSSESHFGVRNDVETRVLRRGADFDHVVLAVSLGMLEIVADEIIADRPEWREMTEHVKTVATQSFQVWLRADEAALGWVRPGATISAYIPPFETWASMPQTLWAEDWPHDDEPKTVAYFCGSLDAAWPPGEDTAHYQRRFRQQVHVDATAHVERNLALFFPHAYDEGEFGWDLLCGVNGESGQAALATQHISANIDPSDRYVQSVPGSDKYRLRPDESGYDNLVLAGDWTDCGLNAGCIEAAVRSGLQAANVLLGRTRTYRIRGFAMP